MGDNGGNDVVIKLDDLPVKFVVKYLGWEPARGLWGVKHTRQPVDQLVAKAKANGLVLPRVTLEVNRNGLSYKEVNENCTYGHPEEFTFKVDQISYGVQDVIYTRIFSIIIVTDEKLSEGFTFKCHGFVCDTKNQARELTYALSAVFENYAANIREAKEETAKKKFVIDLRTPEQLAAETTAEEETDA